MQPRTIIALLVGAAGVLAFGFWLGGASADRTGDRATERTASRPTTAAAARAPMLATAGPGDSARVARLPSPAKPPLPGLEDDLRDPDPLVRRNAITEVDDPRLLTSASRDPDLNVAVAATEGLARLYRDGELGAADLVARTTDAPPKVRVAAINGLGLVASPDSATALADLLARGTDIDRRSAAIVLVHQDPAIAVPALINALGDADDIVRSNARESLRAIARGRDLGPDAAAWSRWWQARTR